MTLIPLIDQSYDVTAFICDSVRSEADGKTSIVGISTGTIQAPAFPVQVQMGVYAQIKPIPPIGTALAFEIRLDDAVLFASPPSNIPELPAQHADDRPVDRAIQIAVDRLMLTITAPGRLGVYVGFDGAALERITSAWYITMPNNPDAPAA